jgi:hypothetical protein
MPKAFDLLAAAAAFARQNRITINDPNLVNLFVQDAAPRLEEALGDAPLIYGSRTENLFEAMVISLGQYKLFKTEDVGRVHSRTPCRAPDFRIVLEDDEQWLVEVKNVRCEDPGNQQASMSPDYVASLEAYADAVGTPLRIAIYWSRWNIWTLTSPASFKTPRGGLKIRMLDAIMASQLARLGDVSIATKPPLRLVLGADIDKPRSLDADNLAAFTISSASLFSADVELTDPKDRQLAEILFMYGEWPVEGPFPLLGEDGLTGVQFVARPEEPSDQGFDGVGWASRIFSRFFAESTVDGDQVIQLNSTPMPDWFAPLATWDFAGSRLPLWLFHIEPSRGPSGCSDSH